MPDLVNSFNGCYCVQDSDNGASLCGEVINGGGKFVMLLKLKPSSMAVHVTLKTENEDLQSSVIEHLSTVLSVSIP